MVYSVCQTTHPSTTVEHSIQCHFYSLAEKNLVVAGANQLSVYRIESKLLEHCQTFELYGNVASLQKIALGNESSRKRDSLVLSFFDAKLSIVEYNPETHDLKTMSMHYFEDDTLKDGRVINNLTPPIVRVDPKNSCIAMLVYGRHIVVIPLDKDEEDLDHELYNTTSSPRSPGADSHSDNNDELMHTSLTSSRSLAGDTSLDRSRAVGKVVALKPTSTNFKSPVLPSYELDLSEEVCGDKIDNIVDIQFLHNYNDPTLVILHEPTRTWSGRVAMRQDTFSIIALSMNVHQRLQPIIWTVNNLPFDSLRILPVPKPIGGLLVVACNALIYLNQSVPAFGMSFNGFAKDGSAFPMNEAKSETGDKVDFMNISLDLSQAVFMEKPNDNKILFILKDGDVFLVTLFNDDMRSIKNFNFERIGSTVQPNCLTLCENNLLFIGSHVGDSILAELVGDLKGDLSSPDDNLEAYADEDDEPMISQEEREPIQLDEHDQILSTSACGRICYGEATNLSAGLRNDHQDPNIELVLTAGHYKNGTICILQRTIKPVIEDTYELKVCGDLWTVRPSKWADPQNARLLLNRDRETMVFATIGELKELRGEECAFRTSEPSVFAGNIGACNLTVQVMTDCVLLISDDKVVDTVILTQGQRICDVTMVDPHLVVLTETGALYHLQLTGHPHGAEDVAEQFNLSCQDIGSLVDGQVISMSVYKDVSGLFSCKSATNLRGSNNHRSSNHNANELDQEAIDHGEEGEDDDELDYEDDDDDATSDEPTYWLFVVNDRGVLQIYGMPNFNLVYQVDNFPANQSVLTDNVKLFITDVDTTIPRTREILMCSLGRKSKRPLLFVRNSLELVIYEVYKFTEMDIANHLKIRFKKISTTLLDTVVPVEYELEGNMNNGELMQIDEVPHNDHYHDHNHSTSNHAPAMHSTSNGRAPSSSSSRRRRDEGSSNGRSASRPLPNLRERWIQRRHWLRQFHGIGNKVKYNGVFLGGFKPHWFVMTDRCELRTHPMNIEGAIYAFSQYDKDNFIYFNEHRELRIAQLPERMNLDSHWPMRKINMNETVHFVNYHVERKVYSVVTSKPSPCLKIMRVGNEPDSLKIEDLERECGYIPPMNEKFRLRLYDSETWTEIPDCEIEFDEWEQVTCVKNVSLTSEGTQSGLKGYIALSTNYCYGEDVPNRGRIFILDLIEVVPEPDRPLTKNKIKKVYCQEQKGPVTTLSHTCGLLMSAVGQKIYLWQLKDDQLDGVAFIDTQIYIHCASSIKNLILVSDICKSVSLLRYQQDTRTLSIVCRDPRSLEVFACDFMIDNEQLTFVVADAEENLMIYTHEPEDEESEGGTRLIRRADYHLGAHVISFSRLRGKIPAVFASDPNEVHYCRRRHLTMFCTVDGALGFLFPIHQSIYRQFAALQNEMTLALPHAAGLNPKSWRHVKQSRPGLQNACHGMVDGDIVRRFLMLSSKERNELTKKIGSSTEKILADIQIIRESTMYF